MSELALGGVKDFEFNIKDPDFLKEEAIWEEAKRVYSKCMDCRMCVTYCPSHDDNVEKLSKEELALPLELCFHCL